MNHEHFMDIALEASRKAVAAGNLPSGAVIVRDGQMIAEGWNRVNSDLDPTAHGEVMAIRAAARLLGSVDLAGCTLYSTMEPCPLCCWSILVSGIECLVLGGRHAAIGRPELGDYSVDELLRLTRRSLRLVTGIRTPECEEPFRQWLAEHGRAVRP